ncbi:hemerythrin HHE cation binding domain-containing protein [Paucimonas lemoignei]|uniref:Hemerythrin HHE cation binding domain-containing protein n=1 Tax=Paucimonas lemoignei TaxID=29443 RepID=A0A4R3I2J9_PAULE|nr:hemerythrin domain-containing protein [Paucimonas lemoignei]TCS39243.1 hemerythrin HHE cation binding domain-containing protein [Paucimonas lemoignei]
MQTICEYLEYDHKCCDDLFDKVETSIAKHEWQQAEIEFQHFHAAFIAHLEGEESIVFPAFGEIFSEAALPIKILCTEHQRIKGIVTRLQDALHRREPADFLLHAETLTLLMQQHSQKEEKMLYPLLDRVLSGNTEDIVCALRKAIDSHTAA